ncbi:glycosyltransferase family 2 protein [Cognatitamlana onchidii]|uniref:glycosyltransferase family 2 protein n=1 Tax=Cognatitamlana onchidii TaxID=2562860 RepID=UPI0010A67415|nr:glycosyltransferase family 2 protein [Algibacter onchidii]
MKPSIAIIVSTYNWPKALNLVLKSLARQSEFPNELIIADDGSRDKTKQLINSFRSKLSFPITHLWQEDDGFRKSIILNRAIAEAQSDYIIQVDGDVILHKHFIKDHRANAQHNTFLFGTRVTLNACITESFLNKGKYQISYFSKDIKKRNRLIRLPFFSKFSKPQNKNSGKLRGCNLSYWRKDAMAINGYNEGFKGWGYEDYEFAQRLINKGVFAKRVKHAAIQFHLFHNEAPKGSVVIGDKLLEDTVNNKISFIENGIIKS